MLDLNYGANIFDGLSLFVRIDKAELINTGLMVFFEGWKGFGTIVTLLDYKFTEFNYPLFICFKYSFGVLPVNFLKAV